MGPEDILWDMTKILDYSRLQLFVRGQVLWQRATDEGDNRGYLRVREAVLQGGLADGSRGTRYQDLCHWMKFSAVNE